MFDKPTCGIDVCNDALNALHPRNVLVTSMLPHMDEREPGPANSSGDSQRARYCSAQPEEVGISTPAQRALKARLASVTIPTLPATVHLLSPCKCPSPYSRSSGELSRLTVLMLSHRRGL